METPFSKLIYLRRSMHVPDNGDTEPVGVATNVFFNLRPMPWKEVHALHCLDGQELENGQPRDLG